MADLKCKNKLPPTGNRQSRRLKITCEILPPGTLKRKGRKRRSSSEDRWDDIVKVCAEVIGDESK
ncbi:hypothetical protein DESC_520022 [Desulfosarcina cetonica]|nr:hypothetical protein DESC_520022 [Desulfosarcina cetonica]